MVQERGDLELVGLPSDFVRLKQRCPTQRLFEKGSCGQREGIRLAVRLGSGEIAQQRKGPRGPVESYMNLDKI